VIILAGQKIAIALRAYSEASIGTSGRRRSRRYQRPSAHTVIFDCESTTDHTQALRFGTYQWREGAELREEGFFYDPALGPAEFAALETYCATRGLTLRTRESFVTDILFKYGYHLRGSIVGHNLNFDLPRIAVRAGRARLDMYGGFSLKVADPSYLPHIQTKHVTRRFSLIRFASPFAQTNSGSDRNRGERRSVRRGFFVDTSATSAALFAKSYTLAALAKELNVPSQKLETTEHGGELTTEYLDYARRDAQTTWECYAELKRRYERLGLSTPIHRIYSEASLGKAYLDEMRVRPWREVQPSIPPRLVGIVMSAYFGGRSEVRIRREIREVIHCDFLSMYPTVCTLLGLWRFVIAKGMTWRDDTDAVRTFVQQHSLTDLQKPETWKRLHALVQVRARKDLFPVRARYDPPRPGIPQRPATIGLNFLTSPDGLWFTLADVVASKLLNGETPEIIRAIVFGPNEPQQGLRAVRVGGKEDYRVDPRHDDFYKRTIELRQEVKQRAALAIGAEFEELNTEQLALKIITNATSYGCTVEVNVQERSEPTKVLVHSGDFEPFQHPTLNVEKPGRFFHPLIGTSVTGAARLMLAITEKLVLDHGLEWAFCDTDSMSIARPESLDRAAFHERVDAIVSWFENLNPYSFGGSILKVEEYNFGLSEPSQREPLYCWCVSSKRYALFNLAQDGRPIIRKASAHGLGHLVRPYDENNPAKGIPAPKAKLSKIGVERWQYDLWYNIVTAALAGTPDTVDLTYHPALKLPAVSRYGASTPRQLDWFAKLNQGKAYRDQVKPGNFLYSAFVKGLGGRRKRRGQQKEFIRPVAPFDKDLPKALSRAFDREKGTPITTEQLATYEEQLAQYHLQPESKFLNGDYVDRGTTVRRHVIVADVELIGKEANRWEEQEFLGPMEDAETSYGMVAASNAVLAREIRDLADIFGQRDLADRLGWSRSRLATLIKGEAIKLSRAEIARLRHHVSELRAEAVELVAVREKARLKLAELVSNIGLRPAARQLNVNPSNLSKMIDGGRRISGSVLERLGTASVNPMTAMLDDAYPVLEAHMRLQDSSREVRSNNQPASARCRQRASKECSMIGATRPPSLQSRVR
jgi:hypothetical protein